jgi:hypothetical protein
MSNIVLHPKQISEAIHCGVIRHIESMDKQRRSSWLNPNTESAGHVTTEIGVASYCEFRKLPYEKRINNFHGPDVGERTQIRATFYRDGRLPIVPYRNDGGVHDNLEHYYVLVRLHLTCEIAGWIKGSDGLSVAVKGSQQHGSDPVLYVPNKFLREF